MAETMSPAMELPNQKKGGAEAPPISPLLAPR